MFVEKLGVFGFKSFNQKLELTFGPGISGVIGPNGCGKSNLVDAFRWVLGEQSSKTLRGDKMEDVIFNGTRDVKPLGMAEVTLTVANDRGLLPTEYSHVTIGRRLYRSGQSEYTINRNPCRLKDVRDLFVDTGMGSHAYSVIERGMVDNVLSDNTGHRRFLFEEASGIMKYKSRRKEALTKLEATQADLVRLSDILHEVERETESLKRQVGRAHRYRELRDRLKTVDLASTQARLRGLAEQLAGLRDSGESLSREEQDVQARLSTAEAQLATLRLEEVTASHALTTAREELAKLDTTITALNHEIVLLREREAATRQRIDAAREQITRLAIRREENDRAGVAAREALAGHEASLAVERERLVAQEKRLKDLETRFRAQRELVGEKKQLSLDLFTERMKREGDARQCRAELEQIATSRRELEEERRGLLERRADVARRLAEAREAASALETGVREKEAEAAGWTERIIELEGHVREAIEEEAAVRREAAGVESSLNTLKGLRRTYEGFDPGVRQVMLGHGQDPAVLGTVADLVHAPVEWVEALRPVLAGEMQKVVTRDVETALDLIGGLEAEQSGYAAFLPLANLPGMPEDHHLLPHHPAIIAQARSLVQAAAEVRPLVDHLLGDVLVVSNLQSALELSRSDEYRGFRFVTPEGALLGGPVVAGGRGGDNGRDLLDREREIDTLNGRLEILSARVAEKERVRQELEGERLVAGQELDRTRAAVQALAAERALKKTEAGRLEGELQGVDEREADMTLREASYAARHESLTAALARLETAVSTIATDSQAADESYRAEEVQLHLLEAERDAALSAVNETRVTVATRDAALSESRERIERVAATTREIEADNSRCATEVTEGEDRLVRLAAEVEQKAAEVEELHGGRDTRVAAVADCERTASDLAVAVNGAEGEAREARRAAAELREKAHGEELLLTELRGEWRNIEARLYEEYELTAAALLEMGLEWPNGPDGEPLNQEQVEATVTELKEKIKRLGPVNLLAIEEYEEKSTRLVFLKAQYEDLIKAKTSLMEAITQINSTASTLFHETFVKVQENFQKTFLVLFQGGECSLELVGDDPLEAEIDIVARPRGKKPQSIAQLSSGERALTAIALLFAIYLVKPSPFCLLDEVDAPLDDANVDRFVAMLKEFSNRTQFIVITHNKKTMEAADTLYGVTMASPGASQVVSVRLSDAEAVRDGRRVAAREPAAAPSDYAPSDHENGAPREMIAAAPENGNGSPREMAGVTAEDGNGSSRAMAGVTAEDGNGSSRAMAGVTAEDGNGSSREMPRGGRRRRARAPKPEPAEVLVGAGNGSGDGHGNGNGNSEFAAAPADADGNGNGAGDGDFVVVAAESGNGTAGADDPLLRDAIPENGNGSHAANGDSDGDAAGTNGHGAGAELETEPLPPVPDAIIQ